MVNSICYLEGGSWFLYQNSIFSLNVSVDWAKFFIFMKLFLNSFMILIFMDDSLTNIQLGVIRKIRDSWEGKGSMISLQD